MNAMIRILLRPAKDSGHLFLIFGPKKFNMKKIKIIFLFLAWSTIAFAQDEWDVNNPPGDFKDVEFTVDEGTWMNLDVSPDGKMIAFDLLGDIYTIPTSGGNAKCIRSGLAWEVQPRFSPDGKRILFTSDAGGGDNIWVMGTDGSEARQITEENFRLLNNAVWVPGSDYIIARKHFTSTRSLGAGEMWMYHISGGEGLQLTKRKNDQQDINEPTISPDGRYLYYSEDIYPGGYFQYNKDPNSQIFVIKRYDLKTGKTKTVIGGPGGAVRPQVSRDGKKLAYVRRVRTESVLFIRELETGLDYPIFKGLTKDQQEAWTTFGVYTGFSWTPDDKYIVIWGKGKLWKVDSENGEAQEIPFKVKVKHRLQETVLFKQEVAPQEVDIQVVRQAVTSPDGENLIFNAAGYLWVKDWADGEVSRLTKGTDLEFEPAFSKDGKSLVYVTWNDEKMGSIYVKDLGSGSEQKVTSEKGIYRTPSFSPDGTEIVYRKEGGNEHQGYAYCQEPGIYTIAVTGGDPKFVSPQGEYPMFDAAGERIFFQTGGYLFGSLSKAFKSVKKDGTDEKTHFTSTYANRYVPSPDNKWIAFLELHRAYIAPFPKTGQAIGLTHNTNAIPVAQVTRDAGINLHWSGDSKKLHWTLGDEYFTDELTERFTFLEGAGEEVPPMDSTGLEIGLNIPADIPEGTVALTNARIITMNGEEVIEEGTIIIDGNRIRTVGRSDEVLLPRNAKVLDCTGKTIIPGIVDVHAHLGAFRFGLSPQKHWQYYANLAYGITTTHDPSSNSEMTFSQAEMVKTGAMVGPRIFTTGTILYGADGDFKAPINSLDDARSALRRTKAFGAFSVKSYNQPRREQRQQVIQAARELGMHVYPEGGSFFYHNMSMVADGHTGVEHNIPVAPLYDDVIQMWSRTKTGNTPTLIVNYGSVNGEYYWYQKTNVWEKERLLAFTPRSIIDARSRHRTMIPDEEYENGHILTSKSCKKLQDSGVGIQLGSHGQLQGLGAHWELWMLAQGGMTPMQALRAATLDGAKYLGMDDDLGSLEKGKLADLVILGNNPLDDIMNSESVEYTVINGRIYDASTMNEVIRREKERSKFYWEMEGSGNAYPLDLDSHSLMQPKCACGK